MGRSIIAFPFLLIPLSSICSPDSTYVCTAQYHKIFILFVQRLSSILVWLFQWSVRSLFAAEAHTYRKWKPIHARKFGYDVGVRPVSVHTDSEGGAKKLSRDREGSLRHMCCCSFRRKINYFTDNQRSCSSKDLV